MKKMAGISHMFRMAAVWVLTGVLALSFAFSCLAEEAYPMKEGQQHSFFLQDLSYEGVIDSADAAQAAMNDLIYDLGGDENTEMVLYDRIENEEGTVYYSFRQAIGGLQVYGCDVKLIVDAQGKLIAVTGTINSGLQISPDTAWEIDQEEAEAIVQEECAASGGHVIPNVTEQTILNDEEMGIATYVWVVYTDNYLMETDRAYLAHYVTGTGEYLYTVPVTNPGNTDALSGSVATFAFDGLEADTWSGTVKMIDGTEKEITVPVMKDPGTGELYLGDLERKILCADYWKYNYEDTLEACVSEDGTWIDAELLSYYNFIRVYDFYADSGWNSPDGNGTPVLLLMNYVDADGQPEDNSFYTGMIQGFQVFAFNDAFGDGGCLDVIGHEYTHCFTEAAMSFNLYENDYGAINEGFSDIMGNLMEIILNDSEEGAWKMGENQLNGVFRVMDDPHKYEQPAFVWDRYYKPNAPVPLEELDWGGVHTNASLLCLISYALDQAGMDPTDQFYFWMNVALAMVPSTDYVMLADLLPWCLKQTGYNDYSDALQKSIESTRIATHDLPDAVAEGNGMFWFQFPYLDLCQTWKVIAYFSPLDGTNENYCITWPEAGTGMISAILPAGDYICSLELSQIYGDDPVTYTYYYVPKAGWVSQDEYAYETLTLESGSMIEIGSDGLEALEELEALSGLEEPGTLYG